MKKTLFLLLSFITFYSCETPEFEAEKTANQLSASKIGDPTKTPDLYIPEFEYGWKDWGYRPDGTYGEIDSPIGLRIPNYLAIYNPQLTQDSYAVVIPYGETEPHLNYPCYIANGAEIDYTGQNDFVVNRAEDGIPEEQFGDYNFPGMLSIQTFCPDENGYYLPIGETVKQSFWVAPTNYKLGFNELLGNTYPAGNMWINAGTADLYFNKAKVRQGKNLIIVHVNPDNLISESNINNNIARLPVNVNLTPVNNWVGTGTLDTTPIGQYLTQPPTNVVITRRVEKGKRIVKLDWECPYHEPFYVKHWFTVKRNGVIKYDGNDLSEFEDILQGNPQSVTYSITTTVVGLGESAPVIRTVTR